MKNLQFKIVVLLVLTLLINGCDTVKRVADNQQLLTKNTLTINNQKVTNDTISNLLYQKPNTTIPLPFTSIPLRLYFYNTARPNIDSILNAKYYSQPEKMKQKSRFLSRKQLIKRLESKASFNNWIKRTGEAPVIVDTVLANKSITRIQNYYKANGWFNAKAEYKINKEDYKKASIDYNITTGHAYKLDTVNSKIGSPEVEKIYNQYKDQSLLKSGEQYRISKVYSEEDRIVDLMRDNGVYHFSQDYVSFEGDSILGNHKINIETIIEDRLIREEDVSRREKFKVYNVKDVNIYTNNSFKDRNLSITDTTTYDGYTIYSVGKLKYKPRALTNAVFITPNTIFKDNNRPLTSRKISDLRTFKYPNIDYLENPDTTLTANIYLTPLNKFELEFSTEALQSNIQTIGFSISPSLLIRNVFNAAETLEISGFTSIGASKDSNNTNDEFFDINELGINFKLTIPRLFSPFNTEKIIPKYMFPNTSLTAATSSQTNIGLDKQTFTGSFNYKWYPDTMVTNKLDLFNIQFVKNLNTANYFNVYTNSYDSLNDIAQTSGYINPSEDLRIPNGADAFLNLVDNGTYDSVLSTDDLESANAINERKQRLTEDNLIFSTNFSYTKDRRDNLADEDFSIFSARLEVAGNLFSATSKILGLEKNEDGKYEMFNVAFSQYVKTELNYIKHWSLGYKNVLAIRTFFGIAIPYGNSTNIPFTKSFFAGGANDNRAWSAYSLGPGSLNSSDEFNEANLKVALSAEHRFNLFGPLNGAFFVDAGNIWNVFDDITQEEATFSGLDSLKDIAVGSGFGLRYDFNFFVLRGDIGFKTYDPQYTLGNRWFNDYNFSNAVYNIGINYPF
ncbi:BamA/TamA family outer membrane protein [Psychroserpens sp. NJDZ02]|uniref:translocation and assembly module lipoprotein TamL n=1 Tax=Psychroserpens sp. NJDZ02 TaxID=2570561 RepID=UPI0010A90D50|nr:BamA/TamA family outer membrane protein [Psychroserpens sp. NJDZ02]QCE40630.1 outer membrane protein assembly factor [Psychroserpens sp. NJDZ02]